MELADARDLRSGGWIVKLWRIFLEKSGILKIHISQMCLHPSHIFAGVAELADAKDLKSFGE